MSRLVLFIVFGGVIFLGILSVIIAKHRIKNERKSLDVFVDHVYGLLGSKEVEDNVSEHINYILEHYSAVSRFVGEEIYNAPITELGSHLSNCRGINNSLLPRIGAERMKFNGEKDREIRKLNLQLVNPFTLLYRGVELVMQVVFGHIIEKFNPDFDQDNSTCWKIINSIITVLGSIASIVTYFVDRS